MSESISTRRWPTLAWLIVSQLVYLLLLIPWLFASMMSIMAFDAGVSTQAVLFVGIIWSYPVWPILFSILAWVAYARQRNWRAVIWTSIPLVLVVLAVTIFFILAEMGL
jgi:peptidoglycan/LPS O-acetylase OafA/YrhL